ncbi:glycosyltransferase [Agrobacterium tumefaciens]|uniref:glycosyltransferase n=1 Tax=Agrobacterium tumefaciens TaxID=358 RepID=UPI0009776A04|nr:hypothetical protein BV900_15055 [Agrobacterium tumefaciens]
MSKATSTRKSKPILSLLIPFRGRPEQIRSVLPILAELSRRRKGTFEVVAVELRGIESEKEYVEELGHTYIHIPCDRAFHKTLALNKALHASCGKFVVPYDIDLVPSESTLDRLANIVQLTDRILFAGYRLMSPLRSVRTIDQVAGSDTSVGSENAQSALYKHLTSGERFGIAPAFERQRLLAVGGWDENYVGWGAEDQDIIERYLSDGRTLVLSPDLIYYHLHHDRDPLWSEDAYVTRNRSYYAGNRAANHSG